jgi:putative flippase GtrA
VISLVKRLLQKRGLRYLIAGAVNTVFGLALYWALVGLGLDRYVAQALGYVAGTAFNYLTYSRGVFPEAAPARAKFIASYAGNYVVNLAALWLVSRLVANAYVAGALALVGVVALNYLVLSRWVFKRAAQNP